MFVYRVEHSTVIDDRTRHACGPMADIDRFGRLRDVVAAAQDAVARVMNDNDETPTPWWDPNLMGINEDEICGVDSMEHIKLWFGGSLGPLKRAGFAVRKYEVPNWACRVGISGQVLFEYKHAQLVDNEENY